MLDTFGGGLPVDCIGSRSGTSPPDTGHGFETTPGHLPDQIPALPQKQPTGQNRAFGFLSPLLLLPMIFGPDQHPVLIHQYCFTFALHIKSNLQMMGVLPRVSTNNSLEQTCMLGKSTP